MAKSTATGTLRNSVIGSTAASGTRKGGHLSLSHNSANRSKRMRTVMLVLRGHLFLPGFLWSQLQESLICGLPAYPETFFGLLGQDLAGIPLLHE